MSLIFSKFQILSILLINSAIIWLHNWHHTPSVYWWYCCYKIDRKELFIRDLKFVKCCLESRRCEYCDRHSSASNAINSFLFRWIWKVCLLHNETIQFLQPLLIIVSFFFCFSSHLLILIHLFVDLFICTTFSQNKRHFLNKFNRKSLHNWLEHKSIFSVRGMCVCLKRYAIIFKIVFGWYRAFYIMSWRTKHIYPYIYIYIWRNW